LGEEQTGGRHVRACFGRETGTGDSKGGEVTMAASLETASSLELYSDSTTRGEITGACLGWWQIFDLEVDATGAEAGALSESDSS